MRLPALTVFSVALLCLAPLSAQVSIELDDDEPKRPAPQPTPTETAQTETAPASEAPTQVIEGGMVRTTAIEVSIAVRDGEGRVPLDLRPEDFEVLEDGEPQQVIGLDYPEALAKAVTTPPPADTATPSPRDSLAVSAAPEDDPWQIVIYFDQLISSTPSIRRAAEALAERSQELAEIGTVEIVAADPLPEVVLRATRDPRAIEKSLKTIETKFAGHDQIGRLRRQFEQQMGASAARSQQLASSFSRARPSQPRGNAGGGGGSGGGSDGSGGSGSTGEGIGDYSQASALRDSYGAGLEQSMAASQHKGYIETALTQESNLLNQQRFVLNGWLATAGRSGPRALFYVSDGFDLDPEGFYLSHISDIASISELSALAREHNRGPANEQLSQTLAASGWVVFPAALSTSAARLAGSAEQSGALRVRGFSQSTRGQNLSDSGGLGSTHPLEPLREYALVSGGELMTTETGLGDGLSGLGERLTLTYQVPRAPDGSVHELSIRSKREELEVRAPQWVAAATPDQVAASTARRLLELGDRLGPLELVASAEVEPAVDGAVTAELIVELATATLLAGRDSLNTEDLRVIIAVLLPDGQLSISLQRPSPQEIAGAASWRYHSSLRVPEGTEKVAVVIDDLGSGAWGGQVLELPRR